MSICNHLFVYGTLKSTYQNQMHQSLLRYASYAGEGFLLAKMYQIDWYPGIVPSDDEVDKVWGELYHIDDETALFALLDPYEDYDSLHESTSLYLRRQTTIIQQNQVIQAWVYWYNQSVESLNIIQGGRF